MRAAKIVETRTNVRPPAVAGSFYPRDSRELSAQVMRFLSSAATLPANRVKALIAPHAGYVYSGQTAAAAFASLGDGARIDRVVVIGPAHYVAFRGIAVPTASAFATPLADVPVDQEAIASLNDLPFVARDDRPHAPEHALEVELPFLQSVVSRSFRIVPLVVGDAEPQEVAQVLRRLWGGAETRIVVSSDLSHYRDYATARRLDGETAALIERGEWARIGTDRACGWLAVAGLLMEIAGSGQARRLALCNSGDTAGSRERVVGYGAWAFEETG
jgi:AmmeMemoRadiSam system protein B